MGDEYVDTETMARLLKVSAAKVRDLAKSGAIPSLRLGRRSPRYHPPAVFRSLQEGRQPGREGRK
jgi:excisionase family DNA binding protein